MSLTSEQLTIIIIVIVIALVVLAVLAPASLGVLLKAIESLVDRIAEIKRSDPPHPK